VHIIICKHILPLGAAIERQTKATSSKWLNGTSLCYGKCYSRVLALPIKFQSRGRTRVLGTSECPKV